VNEPLSLLERAVVEVIAKHNWSAFRVDGLRVKKRENTGVGRYTYFDDMYQQALPDGTYAAPGAIIEMDGIKNGLYFVIDVSSSAINFLELVTGGDESWDGIEREWQISYPE
jgi:hypothetical protein